MEKKEYRTRYRAWLQTYFETHADSKVRAKDVYEQMARDGIDANLATVYRNLVRMEQEKILQGHVLPGEGEKFYQYLPPQRECSRHLHMVCSSCGKIIHLDCAFMREIADHLQKEHGFQLDCGESMLVGLCAECRKKKEERK